MFSLINWILYQFDKVFQSEEEDPWSTFSTAVYILIPTTGLILIWSRKDLVSRLLLQLDKRCISVFCPSLSKREKLLKWATTKLPENWSSHLKTLSGGIVEFWNDGSLLCTLINTAVPGACPNPHRHWKKPPIHAQSIAYKYLGVVPNFSDNDLSGKFSILQERRFINYLYDIYSAMVSIQSIKDMNSLQISNQYLARGMGLYAGERYRKTVFYIYYHKKSNQSNKITVYLRGPYSTYGTKIVTYPVIPQIHTTDVKKKKLQEIRNTSLFGSLSLDLASFLGKSTIRPENDIPIDIVMEENRIKVIYIPKNYGMYELTITADGEQISGSPYNIHIIDSAPDKSNSLDDLLGDNKNHAHIRQVRHKRNHSITDEIFHVLKEPKERAKQQQNNFTKYSVDHPLPPNISNKIETSNSVSKSKDLLGEPLVIQNHEKFNSPIKNDKNFLLQIENNNKLKTKSQEENKCNKTMVSGPINPQHENILPKTNSSNGSIAITELNNNNDKINNIKSHAVITLDSSPSPICSDHIVPEVNASSLSLTEKRKRLRKQDLVTDEYSTFPDNENAAFECLKENVQPTNNPHSNKDANELSSAKSLPNIPSAMKEKNHMFVRSKVFWENLSSLNLHSETNLSKPNNYPLNNSLKFKKKLSSCHKSSDNILLNECVPFQEIKSYKSIDCSLDYCTIFTIEERKQFLLKDNYNKTSQSNKTIRFKSQDISSFNNNDHYFENNECESLQDNQTSSAKGCKSLPNDNFIRNNLEEELEAEALKTHFKKSIQYFQNLEKSSHKRKPHKRLQSSQSSPSLIRKNPLQFSLSDIPKSNVNYVPKDCTMDSNIEIITKARRGLKSVFNIYS